MGIQGEFEQDNSSVLGGTVALREFDGEERKEVTDRLKELGFNISFTLSNVDAIIVPGPPSKKLVVQAKN